MIDYTSSSYENALFLPTKSDPCKGMAFHWNIVEDGTDSKIQIGVVVKTSSALEGSGWVGFGFSEAGGMRGADIVYYEAATNTIVDSNVGDGYLRPMRDQLSQDWSLVRGETTNDGFLLFEAERDLVSANVEDPNPAHRDTRRAASARARDVSWFRRCWHRYALQGHLGVVD